MVLILQVSRLKLYMHFFRLTSVSHAAHLIPLFLIALTLFGKVDKL